MDLKILVDNNTFIDRYYFGEPGLSIFINENNTKVLFDTGYSGIVADNAQLMNIDLSSADYVVLSHGHNDHTWGLERLISENLLSSPVFLAIPSVFDKKIYNDEEIGSKYSLNQIKKLFKFIDGSAPYQITNKLTFLGMIPEYFDFEKRYPIGYTVKEGIQIEDLNYDDSAMVYEGKNGLHIITACSHSGICNIVEHSKQITGVKKIAGIIGGFHLFENNTRLKETINFLKGENLEYVYPCHCVSLEAKIAMAAYLPVKKAGTGLDLFVE